jgi:hypothetical protein
MGAALLGQVDERRGEQRFHILGLYGVAMLGAGIIQCLGIYIDERVSLNE